MAQIVLLHKELQHGYRTSGGHPHMFGLVLLDKDTKRVGQLRHRMLRILADFVDDRIEQFHSARVVFLCASHTNSPPAPCPQRR
ncbi:MAG TPA: hypothetical protein VFL45_01545 [Gammaproteobacteria bacterium]|nr:hypothetical protein [Gammaproteobacteria bacterium]